MRRMLFSTSAGVALLCAGAAAAQQTGPPPQAAAPQVAEQCLADLQTFTEELAETGYGMVGPPGYGMPPAGAPAADAPAAGAPAGGYGVGAPVGGWYGAQGARRGMGAIVAAAEVFAMRGKEESCQTVLEEARKLHQERVQMIEEAGIAPEEVQSWRHEQLLTAVPVTEMERAISIDSAVGAEVRNMKDEHLGDIKDVVLAQDGTIEYALLSRGGFFGLGEEFVPVSWQSLQAVPTLDTFVLDVPKNVVEQAPQIDRQAFSDLQTYDQVSEEVDRYWQEHAAG
jgi:sporulation protein YlmC with PRC-barrel domain